MNYQRRDFIKGASLLVVSLCLPLQILALDNQSAANTKELASFIRLSQVLTDHQPLNHQLAAQYYQLLLESEHSSAFVQLLQRINVPAFAQDPVNTLMNFFENNPAWQLLSAEIVKLWYFGGYKGKTVSVLKSLV